MALGPAPQDSPYLPEGCQAIARVQRVLGSASEDLCFLFYTAIDLYTWATTSPSIPASPSSAGRGPWPLLPTKGHSRGPESSWKALEGLVLAASGQPWVCTPSQDIDHLALPGPPLQLAWSAGLWPLVSA